MDSIFTPQKSANATIPKSRSSENHVFHGSPNQGSNLPTLIGRQSFNHRTPREVQEPVVEHLGAHHWTHGPPGMHPQTTQPPQPLNGVTSVMLWKGEAVPKTCPCQRDGCEWRMVKSWKRAHQIGYAVIALWGRCLLCVTGPWKLNTSIIPQSLWQPIRLSSPPNTNRHTHTSKHPGSKQWPAILTQPVAGIQLGWTWWLQGTLWSSGEHHR